MTAYSSCHGASHCGDLTLPVYDAQPLSAQVAHKLLESLAGSGRAANEAQQVAAHQRAAALEAEETHFQELAGDPAFHPMQRTQFPIGKLLAAVRSHGDAYDAVAVQWTADGTQGASLAQVCRQPCCGHCPTPCSGY